MQFEWDARKADLNLVKHGVSFLEARSVFDDEHALLIDDPDHSQEEERFILLGTSFRIRVLVVVHCERNKPPRSKPFDVAQDRLRGIFLASDIGSPKQASGNQTRSD